MSSWDDKVQSLREKLDQGKASLRSHAADVLQTRADITKSLVEKSDQMNVQASIFLKQIQRKTAPAHNREDVITNKVAMIVSFGGSSILARQFLTSQSGRLIVHRLAVSAAKGESYGTVQYSGMVGLLLYEGYQLWCTQHRRDHQLVPYQDVAAETKIEDCSASSLTEALTEDTTSSSSNDSTNVFSADVRDICSVCEVDQGVFSCMDDSNQHFFCEECFQTYAISAFQRCGEFCQTIAQSTDRKKVSKVGELPCPFFERNGCNCSDIRIETLDVSDEVFAAFVQALGRVLVAEAEKDQKIDDNLIHAGENKSVDACLLEAVGSALSLGGSVRCPQCFFRGEKDSACMHISCENCKCQWCYCCGRHRRDGKNLCTTCDKASPYLENQPGWYNLKKEPRENNGLAALHEFHRRRMAYFLRRLVESTSYAPWQKFWYDHKEILRNVPTKNRHITLADVKSAYPPYFEFTRRRDLQWLNDIEPVITRLQEQLRLHYPNENNVRKFFRWLSRKVPRRNEDGNGEARLIIEEQIHDLLNSSDDDIPEAARWAMLHSLLLVAESRVDSSFDDNSC